MKPLQKAGMPSLDKTQQLLAQAGQPVEQDVPRGTMPDEYVGDEFPGAQPAEPDEQMDYEKTVLAGQSLLFDEKTNPAFVDMLKAQADDPAKAIADVAVNVMSAIDERSGGTIPQAVILPAIAAIVEETAEMAKAHPGLFDVDERVVGKAGQMAIVGVSEQYGVDPAETKELLGKIPKNQLESIVQGQAQYG